MSQLSRATVCTLVSSVLVCSGSSLAGSDPEPVTSFTTFMALASSPLGDMAKMEAWRQEVPEIREVRIPSTADGAEQPALFCDSGSDRPRPLLVVLHSWTADYRQQFSIPYGAWAVANDWVLIHPDYRGQFDRPEATLSELAVSDVVDALRWAREHATIDPDRIYLAGFSGGASAALTMVGRYPELWTAAVAWVPVYDLVANRRLLRDVMTDAGFEVLAIEWWHFNAWSKTYIREHFPIIEEH